MVKYKVKNSSRSTVFVIKGYGKLNPNEEVILDYLPDPSRNLEITPIDEGFIKIGKSFYDELEAIKGVGDISAKKIIKICDRKEDIPDKIKELYFELHDNVVEALLKHYKIKQKGDING